MSVVINGSAGVTTNSGAVYNGLQYGTAQATTSGTSVLFTGIPSWASKVTVIFQGVGTNGTNSPQLQLGTSSGVVTTGYTGQTGQTNNAPPVTGVTTGLRCSFDWTSSLNLTGQVYFYKITGTTWVGQGTLSRSDGLCQMSGTYITLSGTLDRMNLTTIGGTDTLRVGQINILYE